MSVTDNFMKLKNGCHPHFREHPLTPSNHKSMVFTFSGTAGKMLSSQPNHLALPWVWKRHCHDPSSLLLLLPFLCVKYKLATQNLKKFCCSSSFWGSCQCLTVMASSGEVHACTINQTIMQQRDYYNLCKMFSSDYFYSQPKTWSNPSMGLEASHHPEYGYRFSTRPQIEGNIALG